MYDGNTLPAWRINQTGGRSVFSPLRVFSKIEFVVKIYFFNDHYYSFRRFSRLSLFLSWRVPEPSEEFDFCLTSLDSRIRTDPDFSWGALSLRESILRDGLSFIISWRRLGAWRSSFFWTDFCSRSRLNWRGCSRSDLPWFPEFRSIIRSFLSGIFRRLSSFCLITERSILLSLSRYSGFSDLRSINSLRLVTPSCRLLNARLGCWFA